MHYMMAKEKPKRGWDARTDTGACRFVTLSHETFRCAGPAVFASLNDPQPPFVSPHPHRSQAHFTFISPRTWILNFTWHPCELAAHRGLYVSFLTHLKTVCDGTWVQIPGGRIPNDQDHVSESLSTCLTCVLFCLLWHCSVGASSTWVYRDLVWYHWHRNIYCNCLLLTSFDAFL